jgi:hypothetical protein
VKLLIHIKSVSLSINIPGHMSEVAKETCSHETSTLYSLEHRTLRVFCVAVED